MQTTHYLLAPEDFSFSFFFSESACVLLFPCVSSRWRVYSRHTLHLKCMFSGTGMLPVSCDLIFIIFVYTSQSTLLFLISSGLKDSLFSIVYGDDLTFNVHGAQVLKTGYNSRHERSRKYVFLQHNRKTNEQYFLLLPTTIDKGRTRTLNQVTS